MTKNFTSPVILQGKIRSTKTLQANETWYVEFYVDGKRHRKSEGLNRIKNYHDKIIAFSNLRDTYEQQLETGAFFCGGDPQKFKVRKPNVSKLILEFIQYQKDKNARPKTIQSYASKLKHLGAIYGQAPIDEIHQNHIIKLLLQLSKNWKPKTYNNSKLIFSSFFEYCIMEGHIEKNPASRIKSQYVSKTDRNKVFSDADFTLLMDEIDKDKLLSFFLRSIYYTCIRPKELCSLQVKHVDFDRNLIFVPAHISKNKKDGWVNICKNYKKLLEHLKGFDENAFIFSNVRSKGDDKQMHTNTMYHRYVSVLNRLNLKGKGYTMYSFKHLSNVKKFLAGWSLAEIMKANRHASIEETENYLKDLLDFVDITDKEVPSI